MKEVIVYIIGIFAGETFGIGQTNQISPPKQIRVQYPSELRYYGTNATTSFSTDFVLMPHIDFRLLYCDRETLEHRIKSAVCILDYPWEGKPLHLQIEIGAATTLKDILRKSGDPDLINWQGRRPGIRLIQQGRILTCHGSANYKQYLRTIIAPGDFIVVVMLD